MTLEQFAHYIVNSYYVYDGNDLDDITIEESKQKFRCTWYNNTVHVAFDEYSRDNVTRAKEIYNEIINQRDWGQFEEAEE